MTTVGEHIQSTDAAICQNIDSLTDQRELLSQNVLAQLRNLVEGVAVRLQLGSADAEYSYPAIGLGLAFVKAKGQYSFLSRFHKLLEASASHYTIDGDASERLMLKYYEYLLRIRTLLQVDHLASARGTSYIRVMTLSDVTVAGVHAAVAEFDQLGRDAFLRSINLGGFVRTSLNLTAASMTLRPPLATPTASVLVCYSNQELSPGGQDRRQPLGGSWLPGSEPTQPGLDT